MTLKGSRSAGTPGISLLSCLALGPRWRSSSSLPSPRCSSRSPFEGRDRRARLGADPARARPHSYGHLAVRGLRPDPRPPGAIDFAWSYPLHFCPPDDPTSSAVYAIVYGNGADSAGPVTFFGHIQGNVRQLDTLAPGERAIENPAITVAQGVSCRTGDVGHHGRHRGRAAGEVWQRQDQRFDS